MPSLIFEYIFLTEMNFPKHVFSMGILNIWMLANATCGSLSVFLFLVFKLPVDLAERLLKLPSP